jgi:hypothetical protein
MEDYIKKTVVGIEIDEERKKIHFNDFKTH